MATGGTELFYVQRSSPSSVVYKMQVAGAANSGTQAFQTPNHPNHLALRGNVLYWTTLTEVRSATKTGAGETALVSGQATIGAGALPQLALTSTNIYWLVNSSEVRTSPLAGGTGTPVQGSMSSPRLIADITHAYFTNYTGAAGGNVFRHPSGAPWDHWILPGTSSVAVDATNAYVTHFTNGEYVLRVGSKAGNTSTPVQSTSIGELIGVDATHVYGIAGSQVKKLPK